MLDFPLLFVLSSFVSQASVPCGFEEHGYELGRALFNNYTSLSSRIAFFRID